jgi:hypothetical protein
MSDLERAVDRTEQKPSGLRLERPVFQSQPPGHRQLVEQPTEDAVPDRGPEERLQQLTLDRERDLIYHAIRKGLSEVGIPRPDEVQHLRRGAIEATSRAQLGEPDLITACASHEFVADLGYHETNRLSHVLFSGATGTFERQRRSQRRPASARRRSMAS